MILIVTKNIDHTADIVEDWLKKMGEPFIRLTSVDFIKNHDFNFSQLVCSKELKNRGVLNLKLGGNINTEIKSGWFRKDSDYPKGEEKGNVRIYNNIDQEFYRFKQIIFSNDYSNVNWLGKFISPNKIEVLSLAKEVGLLVPPYIITNAKESLSSYIKNTSSKIITKSMSEALKVRSETGEIYFQYTKRITSTDLKDIPTNFFPSFFQEEVKKVMDVRLVYVDGVIYSCGIVSGNNQAENTDFRIGSARGQNRYLNLSVPLSLKKKVVMLMNKLGLNFGCIDMVLDEENDFHFLEVNVLGDFSDISYNCSFHIEEKIALWLANK